MGATTLAVLFALLTALSNASAVTLQHVATTAGGLRGWPWIRHLLRHPLWLLGWVAMLGSLVFQAIALHNGPLSLVQPILVTELVMALLVRRLWRRQRLSALAWGSALVTCLALATLLRLLDPRVGSGVPSATAWATSLSITTVVVAVLVSVARGRSAAWRAGCFASATAILWALEATMIKSATDALTSGAVPGLLRSWSLYGLIVVGVAGLVTEQLALREGPLRVSQPLIVILDPLASVLFGVLVFRESVAHTPLALVSAGAAALLVAWGVVVLTASVPESLLPGASSSD